MKPSKKYLLAKDALFQLVSMSLNLDVLKVLSTRCEVHFDKEININVFTSAFLITLVARLPMIYHPRGYKFTQRLKKEVPYKIYSQGKPGCTWALQGSVHVTTLYANS